MLCHALKINMIHPNARIYIEPARILVIEDERFGQENAKQELEAFNCEVDIESKGILGVYRGQSKNYDLILTNIKLPDICGYEIAIKIKTWQKLNNHYTPIIAFTGFTDDFTRQCCLVAGMEEMITKPLNKETAKRIVKKYIKPKKKDDKDKDKIRIF